MTKLYWVLSIACAAAGLFGVTRCAHRAMQRAPISYKNVAWEDWIKIETSSLQWKVENRSKSSILWSVRYTYSINGTEYTGTHIEPTRDRAFIGYGHSPQRDEHSRTVWYNRNTPSQSVVFRDGEAPF